MIHHEKTSILLWKERKFSTLWVTCDNCGKGRWKKLSDAKLLKDGHHCRKCSNILAWDGRRSFDKTGRMCTVCEEHKPLSEFSKDRKKRLGVRSYCKKCGADKARERRESNPEKIRKQHRQAQRKRRAIKAGSTENFTMDEWDNLKVFYGNKCLACGRYGDLQPDHVKPLSKGGSDGIENIQPLCGKCNREKQADHVDYRNAPSN